jgi:hypothetical protein
MTVQKGEEKKMLGVGSRALGKNSKLIDWMTDTSKCEMFNNEWVS